MKTKFLKVSVFASALAIALFSCKKDDDTSAGTTTSGTNTSTSTSGTTTSTSTSTSTSITSTTTSGVNVPGVDTDMLIDDIAIEALFSSSQTISDEGSTDGTNLKKGKTFGCATRAIVFDSLNQQVTFNYNFDGTTTCKDGRTRSGKFSVTINSFKIRQKGTKAVFTYDNYKVTDVTGASFTANGIRTVENLSDIDSITGVHQSIKVTGLNGTGNAEVLRKDGKKIEWYSNRVRKQTAGASTPTDISDDVIEITGTHGGVSAEGTKYDVTVNEAVVGKVCGSEPQPVKGKMTFATTAATYNVDFGSGACDSKISVSGTADISVNGITQTVTVPAQEVSLP